MVTSTSCADRPRNRPYRPSRPHYIPVSLLGVAVLRRMRRISETCHARSKSKLSEPSFLCVTLCCKSMGAICPPHLNTTKVRFAAALHQLIPGISPPGHVGVTFERITFELSFMPPETFGRFTVILLNEFNLAAGQNDSALFTAGDCLLRLDVKGKRISLTVTSARSSSAAVVLDFARVMIETDLSAKYPGLGIRVAETTMRLAEGTAVGACSPWSSVASKNAALAPPRIVNDTSDPSCTSVFVIHAHSDMHHRESLVKHLDGDGYSVATAVPRRHEHGMGQPCFVCGGHALLTAASW